MYSYNSSHLIIPSQHKTGSILIGDINSYKDRKILKTHQIKLIIACGKESQNHQIQSQFQQSQLNQFKYHYIPVSDNQKQIIDIYFQQVFKLIQNYLEKGGILIYCFSGISRSPAILISYLIKKYKMKPQQALKKIRNKRFCVQPNAGFMKQLTSYYKFILKIHQNQKNKIPQIKHQKSNEQKKLKIGPSIQNRPKFPVNGAAISKREQANSDLITICLQKSEQNTHVPTVTQNSQKVYYREKNLR